MQGTLLIGALCVFLDIAFTVVYIILNVDTYMRQCLLEYEAKEYYMC